MVYLDIVLMLRRWVRRGKILETLIKFHKIHRSLIYRPLAYVANLVKQLNILPYEEIVLKRFGKWFGIRFGEWFGNGSENGTEPNLSQDVLPINKLSTGGSAWNLDYVFADKLQSKIQLLIFPQHSLCLIRSLWKEFKRLYFKADGKSVLSEIISLNWKINKNIYCIKKIKSTALSK